MIKLFKDQLDREVFINVPPVRIISLVPSITELLYELGLKDRIAGITRFCIHPRNIREGIIKVGGTKDVNTELIESVCPDLIIASKEENIKETVEHLSSRFPVWVSDIRNLEDALNAIRMIGEMTERSEEASAMSEAIHGSFENYTPMTDLKAAYFIWRKPYMTVGRDTFIHDMLRRFGVTNVFEDALRYPVVTREMLIEKSPDLVFLSSEPYPFREKHIEEIHQMIPRARVLLVDGEYFSWYGSRMKGTVDYFCSLNRSIQHGDEGLR